MAVFQTILHRGGSKADANDTSAARRASKTTINRKYQKLIQNTPLIHGGLNMSLARRICCIAALEPICP
jgi:hypothetical protein